LTDLPPYHVEDFCATTLTAVVMYETHPFIAVVVVSATAAATVSDIRNKNSNA